MEVRDGVKRLLARKGGISVQNEWLDACISWIVEEEGSSVSEQRLYQVVYEQWLHADLTEVTSGPSLPTLNGDKGVVSGSFIAQITSIVNVGCAAYGQLLKAKNRSDESTEETDKKTFEPIRPTRLLLLALSDGLTDTQAMEYEHLQQLRVDTPPGTKVLLQGEIPYRLGMLLLSSDNVQVLGGHVEHLASRNDTISVLSRILNVEEPVNNTPPPSETTPSHQQIEQQQPPESAQSIAYDFQDEMDDFDDFSEAEVKESGITAGQPTVDYGVVNDEPGHDDWSDDLDDDIFTATIDYNDGQPPRSVKTKPFVAFSNREQYSNQIQTDSKPPSGAHISNQPSSVVPRQTTVQANKSEPRRTVFVPKLNLKQQSVSRVPPTTKGPPPVSPSTRGPTPVPPTTKGPSPVPPTSTRGPPPVSPTSTRGPPPMPPTSTRGPHPVSPSTRGPTPVPPTTKGPPPVASVRPMQRGTTVGGEPIKINSLAELSDSFWMVHTAVKVHARFVRVCERIDATGGEWVAKVIVLDRLGSGLIVHLSNKLLEDMIGFSAVEFTDHISLQRNNPAVRARASKGFAQCQSAISQLNGFMIITQPSTTEYPTLTNILDN